MLCSPSDMMMTEQLLNCQKLLPSNFLLTDQLNNGFSSNFSCYIRLTKNSIARILSFVFYDKKKKQHILPV